MSDEFKHYHGDGILFDGTAVFPEWSGTPQYMELNFDNGVFYFARPQHCKYCRQKVNQTDSCCQHCGAPI